MLAQLGAMLDYLEGYVGRSWGLCRPILKPMVAHVDPGWAKRSEKWEQQKKHCKTLDMLMVGGLSCGYVVLGQCWPILTAIWAHLGAMLAHLGAMLAHLGRYVGPSWGYVGPSWGLCWPILRLCWPILRPMLAHVDPSWATCAMFAQKMLNVIGQKNTVNYRGFCRQAHPTRGRRQGARPLSPTERRETPSAMPRPGGPWPDLWGLRLTAGRRQKQTRQPERALLLLWWWCCCWPMLALFGRRFAPVLALGWPM